MEVKFADFMNDINLIDRLTPDEINCYLTIGDFVKQRLMPLKAEIDAEEAAATGDIVCFTEIQFLANETRIKCRNYSGALKAKMKTCFSREDGDYLTRVVNEKITFRKN